MYLRFLWISEQTIISLYSINLLAFINPASVYCAVRTGSLNATDTVPSLKGEKQQSVRASLLHNYTRTTFTHFRYPCRSSAFTHYRSATRQRPVPTTGVFDKCVGNYALPKRGQVNSVLKLCNLWHSIVNVSSVYLTSNAALQTFPVYIYMISNMLANAVSRNM